MKLDKKIFGRKAYCKGYLRRIPIKYVYANEEHLKKIALNYEDIEYLKEDMLSLENEDYIEQRTKELYEHDFEGIIVGAKEVSTMNYYEQASCPVYDPASLGYVDEKFLDAIRVEKQGFVKCYVVFYANNKSRLVPVEMALVEE